MATAAARTITTAIAMAKTTAVTIGNSDESQNKSSLYLKTRESEFPSFQFVRIFHGYVQSLLLKILLLLLLLLLRFLFAAVPIAAFTAAFTAAVAAAFAISVSVGFRLL